MTIERIIELIEQGQECDILDFKEHFHDNKAQLLHDILCLANNTKFQDAYLVFGINDSGQTVGVENDQKRLNSADIQGFLHDNRLKFFNNEVPEIDVFSFQYSGHEIDVLQIKSTFKLPYFLIEHYQDDKKTVRSGHIYSRTGDRNTPIDQIASPSQVETLWKKRNYLLEKPIDALLHLLDYPTKWIKETTEDFNSESFYYENNPEYRIVYSCDADDGRRDKRDYSSFAQIDPYTFFGRYQCFHNLTCLKSGTVIILDGGRTTVPVPNVKSLGNKSNYKVLVDYFNQDSIEYKLLNLFCPEQYQWDNLGLHKFLDHTLVFVNTHEQEHFFSTIETNVSTYYQKILEKIPDLYFDQEASQYDKERLSTGFILKVELENFRSNNQLTQLLS